MSLIKKDSNGFILTGDPNIIKAVAKSILRHTKHDMEIRHDVLAMLTCSAIMINAPLVLTVTRNAVHVMV